jgi:ribonucleoside-diphosphate reductase alpha chain
MRSMMTAGPALKKCNIAGYNCSYLPIDHPHAFDEVLYILMNGTGAQQTRNQLKCEYVLYFA